MLPFDLVCIDVPYPLPHPQPTPPPPKKKNTWESKENLEVSESTLNK